MNATYKIVARILWFNILLFLSSCALLDTIDKRIPGFDRIFHRNSTAQVGPIKTDEGEIIPESAALPDNSQHTYIDTPSNSASADQLNIEPRVNDISNTDSSVKTVTSNTLNKKETVSRSQTLKQAHDIKATPKPQAILKTPPQVTAKSASKVAPKVKVSTSNYSISGKIALMTKQGAAPPEGIIVRLNRKDGTQLHTSNSDQIHVMDMKNKAYQPGQLIIRKGDTVNFVNSDKIQHNVFSSTGDNAFDLGTFGGDLQRAVRLNEEGVVKVYCNIHPSMAAFVAIDDKGISTAAQPDDGSFEFTNLKHGEYELTLWSVRGEQRQSITLDSNKHVDLDLVFDTSDYEPPKRINKYGEQYKKKRLKREYY